MGCNSSKPAITAGAADGTSTPQQQQPVQDYYNRKANNGLSGTTTTTTPNKSQTGTVRNSSSNSSSLDKNLQTKAKRSNKKKDPQFSMDAVFENSSQTVNKEKQGQKDNQSRPVVLLPSDPNFQCSTNGKNGYNVDDIYEDTRQELGKGTFGDVYGAVHKFQDQTKHGRKPWHNVAVKRTAPTILDYRDGGRMKYYDDIERRCQEIRTLIKLREGSPKLSPVLYMYEYFWKFDKTTGKGDIILVTELLGQELDHWRQQQQVFYESAAKKISKVLLNAIEFMHSRGVVHRDLKLQNVLFRVNGDFKTLKIVDFGLAKDLTGSRKELKDFCGSLGYIAPEIYNGEYYKYEVDMFAFGIILFRLLSGQRPFPSQNPDKLRADTVNLRYKVAGKHWDGISPEALKLVRKLLIGKEQRIEAEDAMKHDWFSTQEESILHVDYSQAKDWVSDDSHSRALALSQAPPEEPAQKAGNRFWLDLATEPAVQFLLRRGLYIGKIVSENRDASDGLICVEEHMPSSTKILPHHIAQLPSYTEKECRRIVREAARIIHMSHERGLAHRNVHMNNFLVDRKGNILVRGLQYAQPVEDDQPLTGHFGYLYSWYAFKAPEIDSDFTHTLAVDAWSLGALTYMLLTGIPPFRGDGADLITNKHSGHVVFDFVIPSAASQEMIRGLLQVDPKRRMTIEQVLNCRWMNEADSVLDRCDLSVAHFGMQDWDLRPHAH